MSDEKCDSSNIIEIYYRSRAVEFSRFCQGLPLILLTFFSVTSFRKRKFTRYLSSYGEKFTLLAYFAIVFSFITGISTVGILDDSTLNSPSFSKLVHSGVWDTIPPMQESIKEFVVTNTQDKSITINLHVIHWNPLNDHGRVDVDWDYDGSSILPNRSLTVKITVTNLNYDKPTTASLDVIVYSPEF